MTQTLYTLISIVHLLVELENKMNLCINLNNLDDQFQITTFCCLLCAAYAVKPDWYLY